MAKAEIFIPTYNAETLLAQTVESLLKQTFSQIEIHIVDNASTDGTTEIAKRFAELDSRVKLHAFDENVGGEGNFNRCIALSQADYVGIFHADDLYDPDIIKAQIEALQKHSELGAVATHAKIIDSHNQILGERFLPSDSKLAEAASAQLAARLYGFNQADLFHLTLEYGNLITCPSVLFRGSVLRQQIGRFRGDLFGSSADLDVWLRVAQAGMMGLITVPLMGYRVSSHSFTVHQVSRRTTEHDILKVLRYYLSLPEYKDVSENRLIFHIFKDTAVRRWNGGRTKDHKLLRYEDSWQDLLKIFRDGAFHQKRIILQGLFAYALAPIRDFFRTVGGKAQKFNPRHTHLPALSSESTPIPKPTTAHTVASTQATHSTEASLEIKDKL